MCPRRSLRLPRRNTRASYSPLAEPCGHPDRRHPLPPPSPPPQQIRWSPLWAPQPPRLPRLLAGQRSLKRSEPRQARDRDGPEVHSTLLSSPHSRLNDVPGSLAGRKGRRGWEVKKRGNRIAMSLFDCFVVVVVSLLTSAVTEGMDAPCCFCSRDCAGSWLCVRCRYAVRAFETWRGRGQPLGDACSSCVTRWARCTVVTVPADRAGVTWFVVTRHDEYKRNTDLIEKLQKKGEWLPQHPHATSGVWSVSSAACGAPVAVCRARVCTCVMCECSVLLLCGRAETCGILRVTLCCFALLVFLRCRS